MGTGRLLLILTFSSLIVLKDELFSFPVGNQRKMCIFADVSINPADFSSQKNRQFTITF